MQNKNNLDSVYLKCYKTIWMTNGKIYISDDNKLKEVLEMMKGQNYLE